MRWARRAPGRLAAWVDKSPWTMLYLLAVTTAILLVQVWGHG